MTYKEGKSPSHGTVKVHEDGTWTYIPDKGYTGNDSFTVIVDDGKGGKIEVPVTVEITEPEIPPTKPNNPPMATGEHKTTSKDTPVSG
ncbi:Ig-like domain-containing protein, partial [Heyndrickxia camelliae]